jgi:hypothetical protein
VLARFAGQSSREARQLLYECLVMERWPFVIECPKHVAAFDPGRASERLAELIVPSEQQASLRRYHSPESVEAIRFQAAETLVALGDARGIPVLIELVGTERGLMASGANRILRYYTQEDIELASDATAEARREVYDAWQRWWRTNRDNFIVNVRAARIDLECCRM